MKNKIVVLFLSIVLVVLCSTFVNNTIYSHAEEPTYNIDKSCELYTNGEIAQNGVTMQEYVDDFNNNFKNVRIDQITNYAPRKFLKGARFQNNCEFHGLPGADFYAQIYGDDNIVNLIPKQLFIDVGEKFYIGKNYGFYIVTRSTIHSEGKYSTVLLFSVDRTSEDINDFKVSIRVSPVMQMDYCYVDSTTSLRRFKNDNNEFITTAYGFLNLNNIDNAVIPMLINYSYYHNNINRCIFEYKESSDLDVSDISFGATVYNGNALNYGDNGYNVDNDYGYFIIGNEYDFLATKTQQGDMKKFSDVLFSTAVKTAIGYLEKKGYLDPKLSEVLSLTEDVLTIVSEFEKARSVIEYDVTNERYYYPDLNLYNTRATQKQYYGNLIRASSIIIDTPNDDKIYFRSNDYAEATYLLSHTDKSDGSLEYSVFDLSVAMTIKDKKGSNTEKVYLSDTISYDINQPVEHMAEEFADNQYYLLPYGEMNFSFDSSYTGYYNIKLDNDVELYINGEKKTVNNGKCLFSVNCGNTYQLVLKNTSNSKLYGLFNIDCANILDGTFELRNNEEYVFKYEGAANGHHIFTTNNLNIVFERYYFENLNDFQGNVNSHEVSFSTREGQYYFILKNKSNTQNVTVTEKAVNPLTANGNISVETNSVQEIFSYTANSSNHYLFSFDCGNDNKCMSIHVYGGNFEAKPYDVYTGDNERNFKMYLNSNETIYFVIKKQESIIVSKNISISYSIETYTGALWNVSGEVTERNFLTVKRGDNVAISLQISEEQQLPIKIDYLESQTMRNMCSILSDGRLHISEFLQLGDYDITFTILWESHDNNGNVSQIAIIETFNLTVHAEDRMNNAIKTYNDESGCGITIDTAFVYKVEFKLENGNKSYIDESKITDPAKVNILSLPYSYSNNEPIVKIHIDKIFYKYKKTPDDNTSVGLIHNGDFGVVYDDLEVNHLFEKSTEDKKNYINCKRHFDNIRNVSTTDKTFILKCDIDLGASASNSWKPLPQFNGVLDGNGHTIRNMIISTSADSGSFGLMESNNGLIQYLTVDGEINVYNAVGGRIFAGIFAGKNLPYGRIEQCTSNLEAESDNYYASTIFSDNGNILPYNFEIRSYRDLSEVGGFVGRNQGFIGYSTNNSDLFGSGDVAGIAGTNYGGTIKYCVSSKNRTIDYLRKDTNRCVAGITGYFNGGAIEDCINSSNIKCVNQSFGNDTSVCPQMAQIIGRRVSGVYNNNYWYGNVDKGALHKFENYDQAMYVSNGEVGQKG